MTDKTEFSWVETVPIKAKGMGKLLIVFVWVSIAIVIFGGLLSGDGLIKAVAPVSIPMLWFLPITFGKNRFAVSLPVQSKLIITSDDVELLHPSIDRNDKHGERFEQYTFKKSDLKAIRYYQNTNELFLRGKGKSLETFPDGWKREKKVKTLRISLEGIEELDKLLELLNGFNNHA